MNKLKTIIMIPAAVIVSLLIGCAPTITQLPSATALKPQSAAPISQFILSSPEVTEGGQLPKDYTCDGSSTTLPLEWSGEPPNTNSFALVMFTIPNPGESHWYWVLYNIPSSIHQLAKNVSGVGTLGNNSVNKRLEYVTPCSKSLGPKLYTFTLFALSASPQFTVPPTEVSRDVLLAAIQDRTLGSANLNVYYSREK